MPVGWGSLTLQVWYLHLVQHSTTQGLLGYSVSDYYHRSVGGIYSDVFAELP